MREITKQVFTFNELSDKAKRKAIDKWNEHVDSNWYDSVYEDAKTICLQIKHFDLCTHKIGVEYMDRAIETADSIIINHGETTDTYKLAINYIRNFNGIVARWNDETDSDFDSYLKETAEQIDFEFLRSLGIEYLSMLNSEYEYITSDEYVSDFLIANEYEFYDNGEMI